MHVLVKEQTQLKTMLIDYLFSVFDQREGIRLLLKCQ